MWDTEHIVARETHPWFMFTPQNLSASCPDCNNAKSNKPVLKNNTRVTYPKTSEDFKIFHPHLDNYSDHILKRGHIYVGKTKKGEKTIYICELLRFAANFLEWDNDASDDRYEEEVDIMLKKEPVKATKIVDEIIDSLDLNEEN